MNRLYFKALNSLKKVHRKLHYIKKRLLLKNKNFTILCNNCIGGCIYHILNKEFLSPTINLYMKTNDFISFLLNINYYIESDLQPISTANSFPVGKLDDLVIFFNHSVNFNSAKSDWNKRKKRIVRNNSYVIIREIDFEEAIPSETLNRLISLYKNVVVITFNKEREKLPHYQYIDVKGRDEFQKNWAGIDLWDRKWNWLRFVNYKGE